MGLDMYLSKIDRNAVGFMNFDIDEVKKDNPELYSKLRPYITVHGKSYKWESVFEEVGYWRKANQIHSRFVENVQDGDDDCGQYEVSREQLEELLEVCKTVAEESVLILAMVKSGCTFDKNGKEEDIIQPGKVILNPDIAQSLLPTQCGFFFGSTDYDESYMEDVTETVIMLQKVLSETDFNSHAVYYSSSW